MEEFAQGHEIREYWQGLARKYQVYKYIRLQHKVEEAVWVPETGKWRVTVQDVGIGRVRTLLQNPRGRNSTDWS